MSIYVNQLSIAYNELHQGLKITSIVVPKIMDQPHNFANLIQTWLILSGFAYVSAISW